MAFCPLFLILMQFFPVGIFSVSRWQRSSSGIPVRILLTKSARLLPIELCEIAVALAFAISAFVCLPGNWEIGYCTETFYCLSNFSCTGQEWHSHCTLFWNSQMIWIVEIENAFLLAHVLRLIRIPSSYMRPLLDQM